MSSHGAGVGPGRGRHRHPSRGQGRDAPIAETTTAKAAAVDRPAPSPSSYGSTPGSAPSDRGRRSSPPCPTSLSGPRPGGLRGAGLPIIPAKPEATVTTARAGTGFPSRITAAGIESAGIRWGQRLRGGDRRLRERVDVRRPSPRRPQDPCGPAQTPLAPARALCFAARRSLIPGDVMQLLSSPLSPFARRCRVVLLEDEAGGCRGPRRHRQPDGRRARAERGEPLGQDPRAAARRRAGALRQPGHHPLPVGPRGLEALPAVGSLGGAVAGGQRRRDHGGRRRHHLRETPAPREPLVAEWFEAQWVKIARSLDALEDRSMPLLQGPLNIGQIAVGCALGYVDLRLGAGPGARAAMPSPPGRRHSRPAPRWPPPNPDDARPDRAGRRPSPTRSPSAPRSSSKGRGCPPTRRWTAATPTACTGW